MDFAGAILTLFHAHPWTVALAVPAALGYAFASLQLLAAAYRAAATTALIFAPASGF